jgi:hypothetical protein
MDQITQEILAEYEERSRNEWKVVRERVGLHHP